MAHPPSSSSSQLSSPLSSSRPPRNSTSTIQCDGASFDLISGGCQHTAGDSYRKIGARSFASSLALVVITIVLTLAVVFATGSGGLGVGAPTYTNAGSYNSNNDDAPFVLRRRTSEGPPAIISSTVLCNLEYCKTNFESSICPPIVEENDPFASIPIFVQGLILLVLLSFSGLFSGLTLGLMSLDLTGLEIVMAGDDPDAVRYAEKIYPLRKQGNLLLCTLLLGNTVVNSAMSIFSAAIFNGAVGLFTSTILIVVFGEILPQALCSRYALRIGSAAVPTVKVIKFLLYIFTYPLAKGLDLLLGRELATTYSNTEMIELLNVHLKANIIDQDEANAMAGALTYKNIQVKDAMTAMEQTFMLRVDEKLSFETIGKIFKTGYSRIPVFEISRNNIIGLLFVKDLIFMDPDDCVPVRSFIQIFGRNVHLVWPDDTLGEVLGYLKKGKSHLAVVRDVNNKDPSQDPFYEVKGIITLEDIVERIIGDSIVDETDAYVDSNQSVKVERGEAFEWARLRLLDTKIVDEMLSESEINAITAHLKTNHPETFEQLTDSKLSRLVSSTPVTTLPTATQDLDKKLPNQLIYEKNVSNDAFTLILSGKVTILVGSENFRSDVSSWSVLGGRALLENQWVPDYHAYVSDGPCRCIQIHRAGFIVAADESVFEKTMIESNALRNPRTSTSHWTEIKSTTSSVEGAEEARSICSTMEDVVPNRRKNVLARLFSSSENLGETHDEIDFVVKIPSEEKSSSNLGDVEKEDYANE